MKKCVLLLCYFVLLPVFAQERVIHLTIGYKTVYFAGKARKAIAVNHQIPAPTLHFQEGDTVTIHASNHLDKGTALHWHGMLVPWQMDGVAGITQKEIPPGGSFVYKFTLKQSGTYWYHAHAGLQEQQGLYGTFLIDPQTPPSYTYNKDYVVVLSDWSNTPAEQILANLKKDGDYYGPRFPLQPSLLKFFQDYHKASIKEKQQLWNDYKMMQQMRMSIYDLNDVAYDTFLINGHPTRSPWTAPVKIGDVVRLRFIGAAANTIFRVKIPGTRMQIVQVQGNDVRPYIVKDFTIAPGETYDVLVTIKEDKPSIIYAASRDTVGVAYAALITKPQQTVPYQTVSPFLQPLPVTREMMTLMMEEHSMHHNMQPMQHTMPTESVRMGDTLEPASPHYKTSLHTKYQPLSAAKPTNDPNKPIAGNIHMELFGYMDRFIWFINGVPAYKARPILLEPGKRYRIIFTNISMMYHPMHIHGHWFILRKGLGAYDPLLHTISVPAGATITADIDADASGQWLFHCHMLYHMMTGMARTFQYTTLIDIIAGKAISQNILKKSAYSNRPIIRVDEIRPIDVAEVKHPVGHHAGFWSATFIDASIDPFHNVQRFSYKGLYGPDYYKLELLVNEAEIRKGKVENADIDIFYWQLIRQFWAVKYGINYFNQPASTPYWQPGLGIEGLLPWYINTDLRAYYYRGSVKLDAEVFRDTQITNNFFLRTGIRTILASKTIPTAQLGNGLNQMRYAIRPYYRVMPGLQIFLEYEHEQDYGVFNKLQRKSGDATRQNTVTVGFSVLL